jgi:hypothetical protein
MIELPLLRFIPFRRSDIVGMCISEGRLDLAPISRYTLARCETKAVKADGEQTLVGEALVAV